MTVEMPARLKAVIAPDREIEFFDHHILVLILFGLDFFFDEL
jgi:hypothetical protein